MTISPRMKQAIAIVEVLYELIPQEIKGIDFEEFPRDIAKLILYSLEIPVITLPNLTLNTATEFLCVFWNGSLQSDSKSADRPIFGLLHVGPPINVIFIREDLPPHIRNYVLAHEIGHFLADIFLIRQLWLKTLPEQKEAIKRAFAWHKLDAHLELQALIKGLPPRPRTITNRAEAIRNETVEREIQADLIARELLAPWDIVVSLYQSNTHQEMVLSLHNKFGLPRRIAWHYCDDLRNHLAPPTNTLDRLFAPLLAPAPRKSAKNE